MNKKQLFVIDSSILLRIIEGDFRSDAIIQQMFELKKQNIDFDAMTTSVQLLHAIYQADPKVSNIANLQKILTMLDIVEEDVFGWSVIEYKNFEDPKAEMMTIIKELSDNKIHCTINGDKDEQKNRRP